MDKVINKISDSLDSLNNKIKEIKEKEVTIKKYKPYFITTDEKKHEGATYGWYVADRLNCTVPQYLMSFIREDGYIEDRSGIMYLLSNVMSIEWYLVEESTIKEDKISPLAVIITTNELDKILED